MLVSFASIFCWAETAVGKQAFRLHLQSVFAKFTNMTRKNIFAIIGSASKASSNERLVHLIADLAKNAFRFTYHHGLKTIPPFDPELSTNNPPAEVAQFRKNIQDADAVLICTPEYVFSIPSGLKNALEWCVATTVFTNKPLGIITASADGRKGHEELQLIMKTVMAKFTDETTLLIQGIKGKITAAGKLTDHNTETDLLNFIAALKKIVLEIGD